jgi:hypothetical protein
MAESTMAAPASCLHAAPVSPTNREWIMGRRSPFSYERLEVYRTAMEFSYVCGKLEDSLPRARADVRNMLARESTNLLMKIARAAAETRRQSFHTFRKARRSAEQCQSVLEGLRMTGLGSQAQVTAGIELLERVDAGLTAIIERIQKQLKIEPLPPLGTLEPEPLEDDNGPASRG